MSKFFYVLLIILFIPSPARAEGFLLKISKSQESVVDIKTVLLRTVKSKKNTKTASYERHGVGVILDKNGFIVTNTHIIVNAPKIIVTTNDGISYEASVIYVSPTHDLSFIKIPPQKSLKPIQFADSNLARIDQRIIGFGRSDYNYQSILEGRIKSILFNKTSGSNEYLELDLNLYQGDSGGPILDQQGRLLGLVVAKRKSQDRSGVAIAANHIRRQYLKNVLQR